MYDVVRDALVVPGPGEVPQLSEEAWKVVCLFDAYRRAGGDCSDLVVPGLDAIAENTAHPSSENAKLLRDIMTRPIDHRPSSLEQFLAERVEKNLYVFEPVKRDPAPREFNSILPDLALSTLDFNSIGRTLLFKGAAHLIGLPTAPGDTGEETTREHTHRNRALEKTIFQFPMNSATGGPGLKMADFNAKVDPLDRLGVYQSIGPRLP